jgi:hypothetical protein
MAHACLSSAAGAQAANAANVAKAVNTRTAILIWSENMFGNFLHSNDKIECFDISDYIIVFYIHCVMCAQLY